MESRRKVWELRHFLGLSGGAGDDRGLSVWVLSRSSKADRCRCEYEFHVGCQGGTCTKEDQVKPGWCLCTRYKQYTQHIQSSDVTYELFIWNGVCK